MFYFALMLSVTFMLTDEAIDKCLTKIMQVSAMIFGPVLSLVAGYGWWHVSAIVKVCKVTGYETDTVNWPGIFLLTLFTCIGGGVFGTMVWDRTTEAQSTLFTEESSVLRTIISFYFRYNLGLRERNARIRRKERREDRQERRIERNF